MTIFGVDLGNLYSSFATVRSGGVDVVMNEVSKRETTTIVSFLENERLIGESAYDKYAPNAKNTIFLVKRFIGMYMNDPHLEAERRFLTCEVKGDADGRLMFGVRYCGSLTYFYPEQVLAMLLRRFSSHVSLALTTNMKTAIKATDCVLAVPCYYTADQRRRLMQSCELADLRCLSLINNTTAAGVDYGIFRSTSLPEAEEEGHVVGILDIGYGETVFSVMKFWRGHLKVLGRSFDRHLGVRDIDHNLFVHIVEEVKKKHRIDVTTNVKATLRVRKGCERLRYLLSGNNVAQFNVESVMDTDIFFPSFQRSTLEELSGELQERLKRVLLMGVEVSGVPLGKFYAIEMIGGGCHIPMFKRITAETMGMTPSFTLDASEAIVRGAAVTAAILSPTFRVREFVVNDLPTYPVKLGYHMENADIVSAVPFLPDVNKIFMLQDARCEFPKLLEFSLKRRGNFKIYAFYDNENPNVRENVLSQRFVIGEWDVGAPQKDSEATDVRIRVRLLANGLVNVESVFSIEFYEVEEPVAEENSEKKSNESELNKNEESPNEAEVPQKKKKKKQRRVELPVVPRLGLIGIHPETVKRLHKEEVEMDKRDTLIAQTRESRNELESYILVKRSLFTDDGSLVEYVTRREQEEFVTLCNMYEEWLYNDGLNSDIESYRVRLEKLKVIGDPASARQLNYEEVNSAMLNYKNELCKARESALQAIGKMTHVGEEELLGVAGECASALEWAEKAVGEYQRRPKTEAPTIKPADLQQKLSKTIESVRAVLQRPAPPPPKPKEERRAEEDEIKAKEKEANAEERAKADENGMRAEEDLRENVGGVELD